MDDLLERLITEGFNITYEGDEGEIILSNGTLRVGIFVGTFPHKLWRNHVLAEHEENFDKWSKHYYRSDIPQDDSDIITLISDLLYIDNQTNREAGNSYGTLVRSL